MPERSSLITIYSEAVSDDKLLHLIRKSILTLHAKLQLVFPFFVFVEREVLQLQYCIYAITQPIFWKHTDSHLIKESTLSTCSHYHLSKKCIPSIKSSNSIAEMYSFILSIWKNVLHENTLRVLQWGMLFHGGRTFNFNSRNFVSAAYTERKRPHLLSVSLTRIHLRCTSTVFSLCIKGAMRT